MNFREKEKAIAQKRIIWMEQGQRCHICGIPLPWYKAQAAHRIAKADWALKKWGKEVIHHKKNLRVTCAGNCNDAVSLNPESIEALELIREIQEELKSE